MSKLFLRNHTHSVVSIDLIAQQRFRPLFHGAPALNLQVPPRAQLDVTASFPELTYEATCALIEESPEVQHHVGLNRIEVIHDDS